MTVYEAARSEACAAGGRVGGLGGRCEGRPSTPSTRLLAAMLLGIAHHGVAAVRYDPALVADHAQHLATDLAPGGLRHMTPAALR